MTKVDKQTKLEVAELLKKLRTTSSVRESQQIVTELKAKVAEATKS